VIGPEREPILSRSGLVEYRLAELLRWRSENGREKVKEEIAQGELSPEELQDRARRFYARYGRELEQKVAGERLDADCSTIHRPVPTTLVELIWHGPLGSP
jgi:hypothetical protein